VRILIADDHPLFRRGLREVLLEAIPDAQIGEAEGPQAALDSLWKAEWDVLVLDLHMPGRGGLEVLQEAKVAWPRLPVLVLSVEPEDHYAVRVLRAGASGYLSKTLAADEVVAAVRRVAAGGLYVTSWLAEKLAEEVRGDTDKPPHQRLSDREFQVMLQISAGRTVSEIARELSLSVQTVSTHRAHLLRKMGLKSNAQLMRYALVNKLVE
jgi:two-component system, NarL family, invasion response regulator UvrY